MGGPYTFGPPLPESVGQDSATPRHRIAATDELKCAFCAALLTGSCPDQPMERRGNQRVPVIVSNHGEHEQESAEQVRSRRSGGAHRRLPALSTTTATVAGEMWQRRQLRYRRVSSLCHYRCQTMILLIVELACLLWAFVLPLHYITLHFMQC